MTATNGGVTLIEAAISNMAESKTVLSFNEMDMKNLARIVFANWKYVSKEIERLTPYVEAFRREEARADKLAGEVDDLRSELERAKDQMEKLARTGQLLLENSVGCAIKHHGLKPSDDLPGWLADAKADIERASAAFSSTERQP